MARGRKALPGKLHVLHGTYREDRHGGELQVEAVLPDPPERLPEIGKQEWRRLAPELFKYKVLSNLDLTTLEMYCTVFDRWVRAEQRLRDETDEHHDGEIARTPNGFQQQSAWLLIANNCIKQMQSLCAEFGMTPATRARMKLIQERPKQLDLLSMLDQFGANMASGTGGRGGNG
jgi:P27 family predicted phage terminase small subunit